MTEALSIGPQSPGSLKEFALSRGLDALDGRVAYEYTLALAQYREELAEARGITLEELHQGHLRDVGRVASEGFALPDEAAEAA